MDPKMLQMMMMMGGGDFATQMAGTDMATKQSAPHINPTNYMTGYEQRRAIRQAVNPQMQGGRISRMMSGMGGVAGMPGLGGGLDPSSVIDPSVANDNTFHDPSGKITVNAGLNQYGLQLPTHTNPFLFFNDQNQDGSTTWAGNHPKVAKAIEGAMIGATTPGGVTTGENIANVAKTVLGVPGLYRQSQAAQMQAPFDMAKQIAGLQDDQINMQAKLASAYHMYATGQAALDRPTKAFSGAVYQDGNNRPYQINTVSGKAEALDGKPDPLQFEDSTKVGTPGKPGNNKYPGGVKTQSERMGYDAYVGAGGKLDQQGNPIDVKGYQRYIYASQSQTAAVTGGSRTTATKGAGQSMGDVSEADKTQLKALEDEAKSAESRAKEKLPTSQFVTNDPNNNPLAEKNAEMKRRQDAATSARKKFNDASSQVQSKQPNSKIQGGGRPTTTIHPDGRIEIK